MDCFKQTVETLRNVQIYPSKVRIEPNDKTAKAIFNLDGNSYAALLHGAKGSVTEKKNHAKFGKISTPVTISNFDGYSNLTPLTEFERAVLSVCISEFLAGNAYTTPNVIFRALIGKVGESAITPSKNQFKAILNAIDKLMFTKFEADIKQSFEQLKYANGDEIRIKKSSILPACLVDAKINGQLLQDVVCFDRESPIFTLANLKNQIVRYETSLLDVPNQNNTPRIIAVKNYVLRRICEIKLHQMTPTITFDDIFKKCRIDISSRDIKMDARTVVLKLFEHIQYNNFIKSFQLRRSNNGSKLCGILFDFQA